MAVMGALEAGAMSAGLVTQIVRESKFKFHRTDPKTGKRDVVELGGADA